MEAFGKQSFAGNGNFRRFLWAGQDLNLRHPACKASALPLSYPPSKFRGCNCASKRPSDTTGSRETREVKALSGQIGPNTILTDVGIEPLLLVRRAWHPNQAVELRQWHADLRTIHPHDIPRTHDAGPAFDQRL